MSALGQPAPARQFIYRIEPVRKEFNLQKLTEAEVPIVTAHVAYLKSLLEQGQLVMAGQAFDPAGFWGIVIINAQDLDAATAIFKADPAVKSDLFHGSIVPFRIVLARQSDASPANR